MTKLKLLLTQFTFDNALNRFYDYLPKRRTVIPWYSEWRGVLCTLFTFMTNLLLRFQPMHLLQSFAFFSFTLQTFLITSAFPAVHSFLRKMWWIPQKSIFPKFYFTLSKSQNFLKTISVNFWIFGTHNRSIKAPPQSTIAHLTSSTYRWSRSHFNDLTRSWT